MSENNYWKRVVSGALAAQLLCAPAAEAFSLTRPVCSPMAYASGETRKDMPRLTFPRKTTLVASTTDVSADANEVKDADAAVNNQDTPLDSAEVAPAEPSVSEDNGQAKPVIPEDGDQGSDGLESPSVPDAAPDAGDADMDQKPDEEPDEKPSEENAPSADKPLPGTDAPSEEKAGKEERELSAVRDVAGMMRKAGVARGAILPGGLLLARGQPGLQKFVPTSVGMAGYRGEMSLEDWGVGGWGDWIFGKGEPAGFYASKPVEGIGLGGGAWSADEEVSVDKPMPRVPNYEFGGWYVYKGLEFLDDINLAFDYHHFGEEYKNEPAVDAGDLDTAKGYPFTKGTGMKYTLKDWTEPAVVKKIAEHLYENGLLKQVEYTNEDGDYLYDYKEIDPPANWSVDGDEENRYYVLFFSTGWTPSKNATLVGTLSATTTDNTTTGGSDAGAAVQRPLYTMLAADVDRIAQLSNTALQSQPTTDDLPAGDLKTEIDESTSYFTRVESDVDKLTISVVTYEPGSVVYVEREFNGEVTQYVPEVSKTEETAKASTAGTNVVGAAAARELINGPCPDDNDMYNNARNDIDKPARSKWTLTIPLEQSQGADALYNELRIVVVPPADRVSKNGGTALPEEPVKETFEQALSTLAREADGSITHTANEKVYTVYAQRLNEPELTFGTGNTPAALVARDGNKAGVLENFAKKHGWINHEDEPGYGKNIEELNELKFRRAADGTSGYVKFSGKYNLTMWDAYASIYNDYPSNPAAGDRNMNPDLDDKAVVVYIDSEVTLPAMKVVDSLGRQVDGVEATRTLTLREVDTWRPEMCLEAAPGREWTTTDTVTVGEAEKLNLKGRKVVPGIYSLEYAYLDPITEENYSSGESERELFPNTPDKYKTFHRVLVVLPIPGDVDMDGVVTVADGVALKELLEKDVAAASPEAKVCANLFLYRVCDVNGDESCNEYDYDMLMRAQGTPLLRSFLGGGTSSDYRYWPLGRKELSNAVFGSSPEAEAPVVTANADKAGVKLVYLGKGEMPPEETADTKTAVDQGETFWVGIRLEDAQNLYQKLGAVRAITMTIAVDGRYVVPVTKAKVDDSYWTTTDVMQRFMDNGQLTSEKNMDSKGLTWRSVNPSKALATFDVAENTDGWEYQLTVFKKEGEGLKLQDGVLVKFPLKLENMPPEKIESNLVELALGMRELCILSEGVGDGEITAAYDCRTDENVYRGDTRNLKDFLEYRGCGKIPVGEDLSGAEELTNILNTIDGSVTYGEQFRATVPIAASSITSGTLPEGIEYQGGGVFEGTAWEAGTFEIVLAGKTYSIEVKKAPLTLTVLPNVCYYGEALRGVEFTYNPEQLKQRDKDAALTGHMDELADVLGEGYTPPTASGWLTQNNTVTGTHVTTDTAVGSYYIAMTGGTSKNYRFNFSKEDGTPGTTGWSTLTIRKRPVFVDKILTRPVYSKSSTTSHTLRAPDDGGEFLTGHSVKDFSLALPTLTEGKYNGLPLTGEALHTSEKTGEPDDLLISYYGMYVLGEKDTVVDNILTYHVELPVEKRDIEIKGVALKDGEGLNSNYELLSDTPKEATVKEGGRLLRDYVKQLRLSNIPADNTSELNTNDPKATMKYTHGDKIAMTSFLVKAPMNTDPENALAYMNYETARQNGIEIFWAGLKMDESGKKAALDENGQPIPEGERITAENNMPLSRARMNGLHLWVHATSYDEVKEEAVELYHYSYSTLDIAQKELTLSIGPEERYYGEPNTADDKTDVTYDVDDLSPADKEGKTGKFWADFNAENLPGYVAPKVKWVTRLGEDTPVEQNSTAYVDHYYVTISGAASTDYSFKYVQKKRDGTTTTVSAKDPLYLGCNTFKVHPRPIIVTGINDVVEENGTVTVPREIYADDEVYSFTESAQAGAGTVDVALPTKGQSYKVRDNGEKEDGLYPVKPDDVEVVLPLTGDPIYAGDKVTVSYQTSYVPDRVTGKVHFDLNTDHETRTVELTDVTITDNTNYLLLFTNVENTQYGYPGTATDQTVAAEHQTTGIVRVREITNVVIKEPLPQLSYVHGDSLTLNDAGRVLTVEVAYKNGSTKSFEYVGDIFANAGLHLTWDAPWAKDDPDNKELLTFSDMTLYRPAHNGHRLYVTVEQLGNLPPVAAKPLTVTVAKKTLELAAVKQYRYFGEENASYEFSFNTGELAAADRDVLREWGGGAILPASLKGAEAVNALQKINEQSSDAVGYVPFQSPELECSATRISSPGEGAGPDGVYPMTIGGGAMTNYDFTYASGFVRVFKRPIFINRVTANPIATLPIESNETARQITLSQGGDLTENDLDIVDLASTAGRYYNRFDTEYTDNADEFDPRHQGLPLTGNPIVSILREDGTNAGILYITLTVNFEPRDQREPIPPEIGIRECTVTISDMILGDEASAANYCLVTDTSDPTSPRDPRATGLYTSRKIKEFSVQRQPSLSFQYGDFSEGVFSQSKLRPITFNVSYESAGTVQGMSYSTLQREVTPEVYYWDHAWPIPGADYLTAVDTAGMTTAEAEAAQKAYITQQVTEALADKADYKVSMGDHLSRTTIEKNGTEFAHQGMALLIAVRRQEMEGEDYAVPVLTSTTIDITRKNIAYDVTAADKVYDGTVATSGTLTLKDAYPGDDVWVDTDAIKFNFVDPNVAYADAAGPHNYGELDTVTVEVSGIRLMGHDGDNYSIDEFIGKDYTPTAGGRPSAAPEATIWKAPRPAPILNDFILSVDNHTNVLTVTHSGVPEGDSGDQHNGEIHFEYALGHPVSLKGEAAEGTALTAEDFDIEITPWQDGLIFGGEKVGDVQSVPAEDIGFGSREPLPKDTWFRVDVRIGESWNYLESPSVYSIEKDAFLVQDGMLEPAAGESVPAGQAAAKTYRYRIDLYALPEKRDETVELREIWFNDVDLYEKADKMHMALENEKNVRGYFDYYWDDEKRLQVRFPWNLAVPQTVTPGGGKDPITIPNEGQVSLYATTKQAASGIYIPPTKRELTVDPTSVEAHLGDKPFQLTAVLLPEEDLQILWSSSDEKVVRVDENGLLTFVGVGEAVITVRVQYSKLKVTIPVVVLPADPRPFSPYAGKLLDVYSTEAFMFLDKYMEFHPNWTMNRGEVALIMARLLIEPEGAKPGEAIKFSDIKQEGELAEAVDKLSKWGIVNGIPDGGFQPERDITRAEVVVMLSRMLWLKKGPETDAFLDAGIEVTWAAPYLKELVEADVIRGIGDGYFCPGRVITRAELAAMLGRLLTTRADETRADIKIPSDMDKTHWAYEYALRAVNSDAMYIETKKD